MTTEKAIGQIIAYYRAGMPYQAALAQAVHNAQILRAPAGREPELRVEDAEQPSRASVKPHGSIRTRLEVRGAFEAAYSDRAADLSAQIRPSPGCKARRPAEARLRDRATAKAVKESCAAGNGWKIDTDPTGVPRPSRTRETQVGGHDHNTIHAAQPIQKHSEGARDRREASRRCSADAIDRANRPCQVVRAPQFSESANPIPPAQPRRKPLKMGLPASRRDNGRSVSYEFNSRRGSETLPAVQTAKRGGKERNPRPVGQKPGASKGAPGRNFTVVVPEPEWDFPTTLYRRPEIFGGDND